MPCFSNLWLAPLAPLLSMQGRAVRRDMPRLPVAAGPSHGVIPGKDPVIKVAAVGESPIAGVGVERMDKSLVAQLAAGISKRTGQAVSWRAYGLNGATVEDNDALVQCIDDVKDELRDIHLLIICMGVSDTLSLTSCRRFSRKIDCLILRLRMRLWPMPVLLTGVPQPERFLVRLPNPLRWVLSKRARRLDAALARMAEQSFQIKHCPSTLPADTTTNPEYTKAFASDGFHPGPEGYRLWAEYLLPFAIEMLELSKNRAGDCCRKSALDA